MARSSEGRLVYADLLRVLATFGVIVIHVCSLWFYSVPVGSFDWTVYNVFDSLARASVPLFVMLSGMFLLDPKHPLPLPKLFFHNILRVFLCLVVWGAVYAVVDYGFPGGVFSWGNLLSALYRALSGETHYHLWFLYIILGLYLVSPILRAFVRGASRGDLHYFLLLCFLITFLLPTLQHFYPSSPFFTFLSRLGLHLVAGYVGYFVAGYYLKTYTLGRIAELLLYILGLAGAVVTVWGTARLSAAAGQLSGLLYDYLTPNVCAMAVAAFVLFRYLLGVSDERSRRRSLSQAAQVTFGVYLIHDLFLILFRFLGLTALPIPALAAVPALSALTFLCAFAVAWLLHKIPFVGKYLT